ncbi:MAG: hypothetical protein ACJA2P_002014 [Rhodoferax sp.]|jgi:hypothetical protein
MVYSGLESALALFTSNRLTLRVACDLQSRKFNPFLSMHCRKKIEQLKNLKVRMGLAVRPLPGPVAEIRI